MYKWNKFIIMNECGKYRKFKNPKIWYTFNETLVFSIICRKYGCNNDMLFEK